MVSTSRVIQLGLASLAVLALSGWQTANAQCNTSAWSGVNGTPLAGSPNSTPTAVARYSGSCGLRAGAAAPSNVNETARHSAEGSTASPLHARFFVYTGITAGSPVVFQGRDSVGGTVLGVTYDRAGQQFTFSPPGVAAVSTATNSALANRWIEVQFDYQAGQPFTARTISLGVPTAITPTAALSGTAAAVEEVRLGLVAGTATGTLQFDEYEASRAIGAPTFTLLCRGDSNKDALLNVFDVVIAINERLNGTLAAGQPDCNEDGTINVFDAVCITGRRIAGNTCS